MMAAMVRDRRKKIIAQIMLFINKKSQKMRISKKSHNDDK
jgi:hypothetical protein